MKLSKGKCPPSHGPQAKMKEKKESKESERGYAIAEEKPSVYAKMGKMKKAGIKKK